ncbi:MAG: MaoC family dehydratase N-terminal domain-containing protein [Gammaproteobacteria bacterium]|nr:MAG: MaoC family dehydratase N-terminal domain-containing protein [Gammaproteobacteria bacterium]
MEKSFITDDLRKRVGTELGRAEYEVEKGRIRSLADATLDDNPLYQDGEVARGSRYGGMIAPPAIVWPIIPPQMDWYVTQYDFPLKRLLNAGFEQELFEPVRPGDRLTGVVTLAELEEKEGRIGHMVFFHFDVVWTNQRDQKVMSLRQSFIKY